MTEKELMHFEYDKWIKENIERGAELGKENEQIVFKEEERLCLKK